MQRLVFSSWRLLLHINVALTFFRRAVAADIYEQHVALNNLYDALNGTAWDSNTGWGGAPTNTTATYCTWKGVYCCYVASSTCIMPSNSVYLTTCSTPCAVLGLSLANNNLVGQIADSNGDIWDALEAIEFLNLQGICCVKSGCQIAQNIFQAHLRAELAVVHRQLFEWLHPYEPCSIAHSDGNVSASQHADR